MEKSTGRVNGNNMQTSVIIDLAKHKEQEDEKMYDVDVKPTPKDYVLDQIFCGDNITVYALFEFPEGTNGTADKQMVEVANLSVDDDFRFYHKSSYKKAIGEKIEGDSEESVDFLAVKDNKNESFYCLKQYDMPRLGDDSQELKVLFSKDVVSQSPKPVKVESKGVNTDIAQCPKLLDEVHRAVNLNFPKNQGNFIQMSLPPLFNEVDARPSTSSTSSPVEAREPPPPTFVVVPLIMMEEGMLSQIQQKTHKSTAIAPNKTSLGTNTEERHQQPEQPPSSEAKDKIKDDTHSSGSCLKNECKEKDKPKEEPLVEKGKKESQEEERKPPSKETILEEVKNLQWKLNDLIKSLESKDFGLNLKKEEVEDQKLKLGKLPPEDLQMNWKSQNKFGYVSTFPSLKLSPSNKLPSPRNVRQKLNGRGERKKLPIVRLSASIDSLVRDSHTACEDAKVVVNWKNMIKWRKVGESKSESNNTRFAISDPKHGCFHPLKKSMSLDLREDKPEGFGIKRMRNATLKIEGNLKAKANIRLKLNGETFFGDKMAFLNCEMGDEAKSVIKSLQLNLSDLVGVADADGAKDNPLKFCRVEGDSYQKHGLISPKFTDKLAVHYCSANANTAISDKNENNSIKKSRTVEKNVVEKTKIPNRSCNKFAVPEVKGNKTPEKSKKEMVQEMPRPKSVAASRKSSSVRRVPEVKPLSKGTRKANHESKECVGGVKQAKILQDDKFVGKGDAASGRQNRPPSQKRQTREKEAVALDSNHASPSMKRSVVVTESEAEELTDEAEIALLGAPILLSSRNPSSVIFELFNKKPASSEEINFEEDQEILFIEKTPPESVSDEKDYLISSTSTENNESSEKPVVKSVWALTKVLLYEDGTKKFEVLEASLTPPEYSLTREKTTDTKSR